jgi:hypothetical protein
MKELMIHVERIVRPLRGDVSKLRMRRELLAHLQAAYDQERGAGRNHDEALDEAKRRLGDPASLAAELQASVPWYETIGAAPFPRWLSVISWTAALVAPLIGGALIVLPAVPFPARALCIAGILLTELCFPLWFLCVAPFFTNRISWPRILITGLAALSCQLLSQGMMAYSLSNRIDLSELVGNLPGLLLIPAFCIIPAVIQRFANRHVQPWLDLQIAE